MLKIPETSTRDVRAVIGNSSNFWSFSSATGFNLTRSSDTDPSGPKRIQVQTSTTPITIRASQSALIIIDMQNYFLHPGFGRSTDPSLNRGHAALHQLITHAIPAARQAGIRIVWLNWGLTEEDLRLMPPSVLRMFGFYEGINNHAAGADALSSPNGETTHLALDKHGQPRPSLSSKEAGPRHAGLGTLCGMVDVGVAKTGITSPARREEASTIDAGRLLMRDSWNAELYAPLQELYLQGRQLSIAPDVWMHKNRMSGMWGARTECEDFLVKEGITTLFFAGVNTDQCVGGTLTDCFSKGYDCVLLSDGCGTASPGYAQECIQFNAAHSWGFQTTCCAFAEGMKGSVQKQG